MDLPIPCTSRRPRTAAHGRGWVCDLEPKAGRQVRPNTCVALSRPGYREQQQQRRLRWVRLQPTQDCTHSSACLLTTKGRLTIGVVPAGRRGARLMCRCRRRRWRRRQRRYWCTGTTPQLWPARTADLTHLLLHCELRAEGRAKTPYQQTWPWSLAWQPLHRGAAPAAAPAAASFGSWMTLSVNSL